MDKPESMDDVLKGLGFGENYRADDQLNREAPEAFDQEVVEADLSQNTAPYAEYEAPIDQAAEELEYSPRPAEPPVQPTGYGISPETAQEIKYVKADVADIQSDIESLQVDVKAIAKSSEKTAGEIREMHKLYHNEFANRLKSMQEELERYREADKGRIFDGLLGEVAKLYSDNECVIDKISDDNVKKQVSHMFMDILQILESNGVVMLKSKPGDKRNTRHCQVRERVSTDDPALHDTIVKSRHAGFYVENRSLVKESVDIYLLDN